MIKITISYQAIKDLVKWQEECHQTKMNKLLFEFAWLLRFSVNAYVWAIIFNPGCLCLLDYFKLVNMEWNFRSVCSNLDEILALFTLVKFLHVIVILFLYCFRLSFKVKPHLGFRRLNFRPGRKLPYNLSLKRTKVFILMRSYDWS